MAQLIAAKKKVSVVCKLCKTRDCGTNDVAVIILSFERFDSRRRRQRLPPPVDAASTYLHRISNRWRTTSELLTRM